MPLIATSLSSAIKPIWFLTSQKAFLGMQKASVDSRELIALEFGTQFSTMAMQIADKIVALVATGIVNTPLGSAPPKPLSKDSLGGALQPTLLLGASDALLESMEVEFSPNISSSEGIDKISKAFGDKFSKIVGAGFGTALSAELSNAGFLSVSSSDITSKIKPIFKEHATKAMKSAMTLDFPSSTKIKSSMTLTSLEFGKVFSKVTTEFSDEFVKILKSSPVSIPLGVGKIS